MKQAGVSTETVRKRKRPCTCCRMIRDMLKPTMDREPPEMGIAIMFSALTIKRIYANAKKGARG